MTCTSDARVCATCGGLLSEAEPVEFNGVPFVYATIRDDVGVHHSACWGKGSSAVSDLAVMIAWVEFCKAQADGIRDHRSMRRALEAAMKYMGPR